MPSFMGDAATPHMLYARYFVVCFHFSAAHATYAIIGGYYAIYIRAICRHDAFAAAMLPQRCCASAR